jgi:GT2 family glycosyltransferase
MNHRIAIISVGVNCLEYSKKTFDSVKTKHPYQLIFVNNGSTDGTREWLESREDIISYQNPILSGLSACWNLGINRGIAEGCDLFLVLNNDIVLAPNAIDNMVQRLEKGDVVMVTGMNNQSITPEQTLDDIREYKDQEANNHPDFSDFLIGMPFLEKVGYFDENYFVAYFEDNDMAARMALAEEDSTSLDCASYFHYGSKTTIENPRLQEIIHDAFRRNKEYFVKKWGCEPLGDVPKMREQYYKYPFNDYSRDITNIGPYFSL